MKLIFSLFLWLISTSVYAGWAGSGFFVNDQGYIVTAAHVVSNRSTVYVLYRGNYFAARVVAKNSFTDTALIQIQKTNTPYLSIQLTAGNQSVAVIGYPLSNLNHGLLRMTTGTGYIFNSRIEVDVKTCPGNSGGPVITSYNTVLGTITGTYDSNNVDNNKCSLHAFGPSSQQILSLLNQSGVVASISSGYGIGYSFNDIYSKAKNLNSIVYIEVL